MKEESVVYVRCERPSHGIVLNTNGSYEAFDLYTIISPLDLNV